MLADRYARQNDAAGTHMRAAHHPIVDGGTHWMVLSAAIKHPTVWYTQGGTWSITLRLEDAFVTVIVDHELTVGRPDIAIELKCTAIAHKAQAALSAVR